MKYILSILFLSVSLFAGAQSISKIPAKQLDMTLNDAATNGNTITGKLGIGSSNAPTTTLSVTGTGSFSGYVDIGGGYTNGGLSLDGLGGGQFQSIITNELIFPINNAILYTNGSGIVSSVNIGDNLTFNNGTLSATFNQSTVQRGSLSTASGSSKWYSIDSISVSYPEVVMLVTKGLAISGGSNPESWSSERANTALTLAVNDVALQHGTDVELIPHGNAGTTLGDHINLRIRAGGPDSWNVGKVYIQMYYDGSLGTTITFLTETTITRVQPVGL